MMYCQKDKIWRLLAVIVLTSGVIVIITSTTQRQQLSLEKTDYLSNKLPIENDIHFSSQNVRKDSTAKHIDADRIKVLAKLIHNAKKRVRGSKTSKYLGLAIFEMNKLLKGMNITPGSVYRRITGEPVNVCPERFKDGSFGFPLYHKGFLTTQCGHAIPLSKLITIVKYLKVNNSVSSFEIVDKFLMSVSLILPDVSVVLSTNSKQLTNKIQNMYPDTHMFFTENRSEGSSLNSMILNVKTPYVLVARDVEYFTNDSRLERLIGKIESLNVVAAGGSFRFPNGHWSKGCFQVLYRNFTLKYFGGYDESVHECLFCDFIEGPFVSSTKYLMKVKFKDINGNNGLYEDLFLRIFQKGNESVVCPDSMFHINPRYKPYFNWDIFMKMWKINEIITAKGFKVNLKSAIFKYKGSKFANLDKLQKSSNAVKVIMLACIEAGVVCELQKGIELAAVKIGKIIPWDIDFDIRFLSNNCAQCQQLSNVFRKRGIEFGDFVKSCCPEKLKLGQIGYVRVGYIQSFGNISVYLMLNSSLFLENGIEPTQILFDGAWLQVPRNPGMSMRNRYGREIYQHAEHWKFTGGNSTNGYDEMKYTTNMFLPCKTPRFHDCLDRYNADGNLQFKYLLP